MRNFPRATLHARHAAFIMISAAMCWMQVDQVRAQAPHEKSTSENTKAWVGLAAVLAGLYVVGTIAQAAAAAKQKAETERLAEETARRNWFKSGPQEKLRPKPVDSQPSGLSGYPFDPPRSLRLIARESSMLFDAPVHISPRIPSRTVATLVVGSSVYVLGDVAAGAWLLVGHDRRSIVGYVQSHNVRQSVASTQSR